jgi:O-antigen/teichoic acid export membrane protein
MRINNLKLKTTKLSPLKKILFTVFTQSILGLLSIVTGFLMPKYMGPKEYGYWQIYFFYVGYINMLGLGFNDGLVLNYAGYELKDLPLIKLRSAIKLIICYSVIISIIMIGISVTFSNANLVIYLVLALNIVPTILFCIFNAIFLATNQSILYNISNLLQRLISCVGFIVFIVAGITGYQTMILTDTIARIAVTLLFMIFIYQFVIGKEWDLQSGFNEIKSMVSAGIKLTLSIVIAGLIPMFGRIVIEWYEPIEIYAVYSFTLTLLSIILTFTSTIGIIIFPMIKRLEKDKLANYYIKFSNIFEVLVFCALIIYVPLEIFIKNYMIEYISSLNYLCILLAVCIPLGKMQLLVITYYKAYRLEKNLLISNILGFFSMLITTIFVYKITQSVFFVALNTLIVMTIYYKLSEIYLLKKINVKATRFSDLVIMILFLIYASINNSMTFLILYGISLVLYLIINRKKLKETIDLLF